MVVAVVSLFLFAKSNVTNLYIAYFKFNDTFEVNAT